MGGAFSCGSRISTATFEIRVSIQSEIEEEEGANFILFDPKHATRVNPVMAGREETLWRVSVGTKSEAPSSCEMLFEKNCIVARRGHAYAPSLLRATPTRFVGRPTLKKAAHRLPACLRPLSFKSSPRGGGTCAAPELAPVQL